MCQDNYSGLLPILFFVTISKINSWQFFKAKLYNCSELTLCILFLVVHTSVLYGFSYTSVLQSGVSEVIYFVEKRLNNSDVAYIASHKLLSMAGVKVRH